MIRIVPLDESLVAPYRAARLEALRDTPLAFGSTFANDSRLTDDDWLHRARTRMSDTQCLYLAFDDAQPGDAVDRHDACGLAGAFHDASMPAASMMLYSMWVAPTHRRHGVGVKLVQACIDWCAAHGAEHLHLMVTDWNAGAISFYETLGFAKTGRSAPYPNDPRYVEFEMARKV